MTHSKLYVFWVTASSQLKCLATEWSGGGFSASFTSEACTWDFVAEFFCLFYSCISTSGRFFHPRFLYHLPWYYQQENSVVYIQIYFYHPLSKHKEWTHLDLQIQTWVQGDDTGLAIAPQASSLFSVCFRSSKMSHSLFPERSQDLLFCSATMPPSCQSNGHAGNSCLCPSFLDPFAGHVFLWGAQRGEQMADG